MIFDHPSTSPHSGSSNRRFGCGCIFSYPQVVLFGDFAVVLGENEKASAQIEEVLKNKMATDMSLIRSQYGSDGRRILIGSLWVLRVEGYPRNLFCGHQQAA